MYAEQGQHEKAAQAYRESLNLVPQSLAPYVNLATMFCLQLLEHYSGFCPALGQCSPETILLSSVSDFRDSGLHKFEESTNAVRQSSHIDQSAAGQLKLTRAKMKMAHGNQRSFLTESRD